MTSSSPPLGRVPTVANVFWTAKDERAPREWEDGASFDPGTARYAVADGASAAYRAREWAAHLVTTWTSGPPAPDADADRLLRWFEDTAAAWRGTVEAGPEPTPWYLQDAERRGSFAAFLGVQLHWLPGTPSALTWSAAAVGDCCLFQVRDDDLVTAFPLTDPAAFGNTPDLAPTAPERFSRLRQGLRSRSAHALPGDVLFLATDALAQGLLRLAFAAPQVWAALRSLRSNADLAGLLAQLRRHDLVPVDDVTLLRVLLPGAR